MGAYEREGYQFEVEFSQVQQKGAMHVYKNGEYKQELPFYFQGHFPNNDQMEELIEQYLSSNRQ
ncbi:DUF5370 family protein [Bacillus tianshenii]|nr:DUF5370 family protein [Bacillus tianshenii]